MPAHIPMLADPPAEDLNSLEPVCQHVSTWRSRRARKRSRSQKRLPSPPPLPSGSAEPDEMATENPAKAKDLIVSNIYSDQSEPLETRLSQLEEVVRDCAVLLRSSVVGRLDRVEKNLADEAARLDERLHNEARRRCRLLTEVTVKVSAAIDQLRMEAKSASAGA